jgi:C-terminal processing protease CtpA/Prc
MTQEALAYVTEALDYIQAHSVRRMALDWSILRQEVLELAAEAQTPAETYPAIERALELLGDQHSFFSTPEQQRQMQEGKIIRAGIYATYPEGIIAIVDPGSPAERAGVQCGERIEHINGQPFATLTRAQWRKALRGEELDLTLVSGTSGSSRSLHLSATSYEVFWLPKGRRLVGDIGYLDVPALLVGHVAEYRKAYARTAQRLIRNVDQHATCGWVIDLRRNVGGGVWPMWVGVGPVLGEGECVSFVAPDEKMTAIYRAGRASVEPKGVIDAVEEPYVLKRPNLPVAVLTSPLTSSAGEFVALAFRGRPRTRSFGEPTGGVPTANDGKVLRDGAVIALTTYLGADRAGRTYDGPLLPDHPVTIDWSEVGTDNDPVLQAAIAWLSTEEDCLSHNEQTP